MILALHSPVGLFDIATLPNTPDSRRSGSSSPSSSSPSPSPCPTPPSTMRATNLHLTLPVNGSEPGPCTPVFEVVSGKTLSCSCGVGRGGLSATYQAVDTIKLTRARITSLSPSRTAVAAATGLLE